MEAEKIRVYFASGYGGKVHIGVNIGNQVESGMTVGEVAKRGLSYGKDYVIDPQWLAEKLEKEIAEKGYRTSITKRQKYTRLFIND